MLFERADSLASLHRRAAVAETGRGSVMLISGEAGIGKSSLLEVFRNELLAAASTVTRLAWGACDALFTPRPLGPLYDMAPELGPTVQGALEREVAQPELFAALLDDLRDVSAPSILVFEDLHWADHATLDCIKFLGRRVSMLPVLLVLTYRSDEVVASHPLTQVLGDLPSAHVHRLALAPLSVEAIEALSGGNIGISSAELHAVTNGNPFFATEVLAEMSGPRGAVPASIRDAVATRLSRLEPSVQEFLMLLSSIPGAVSQGLLEAIVGAKAEELTAFCVQRGLLVQEPSGSIKFRHELARQATFARLEGPHQRKVHAQVLAGLQMLHEAGLLIGVDQLVHHAAGAFDGAAVLEWVPVAAQKATRVGGHREAAAHLATGLRFVESATPEMRARLNEAWAYEAFLVLQTGDEVVAARQRALELWRELGRVEKVGENLRWLSRLHWYRGESELATHYADEAVATLESLPPSAERAMAYSLRSQLHMLNDRMEDAIKWGRRALELAEQFSSLEARVHSLNNVGTAMLFRGQEAGQDLLQQSLTLAIANNRHEDAARVYTNLAEYAVEFRKFDLAEQTITSGIAFDTEHDLDSWTSYLVGRLAQLRLEQGRLRDAQTVSRGVLELTDLTLLMRLPALTMLARTSVRLGENDSAELLSEALRDGTATNEVQNMVPVHMAYIEACWLAGTPEAATPHFAFFSELGGAALSIWVRGEIYCWAHRFGIKSFSNVVLAELPEPVRMELGGDLAGAAAAWQALGAPYAAALALLQTPLTETNAHAAFTQALRWLEPLEAKPAIARAEHSLALLAPADSEAVKPRSTSGKARGPYAAARSHPLGLTAREQEVLALLAKGGSNQDISAKLSRSRRTVEHHVSSLLAKLNAATRVEAMLRVQNEPWLITVPESSAGDRRNK